MSPVLLKTSLPHPAPAWAPAGRIAPSIAGKSANGQLPLGGAAGNVVVFNAFAGWDKHGSVGPAKTVGAAHRPQHQKWQHVFFKKVTAAGAISFCASAICATERTEHRHKTPVLKL